MQPPPPAPYQPSLSNESLSDDPFVPPPAPPARFTLNITLDPAYASFNCSDCAPPAPPGKADGFTQFDTISTLYGSNINGTLYGGLNGVRVDENGYVIALFTNGIERSLYKLPVATFLNADGLGPQNGNAYRATVESGTASFKAASQSGAGKISNLAVEQSTVDIAKEFSDMIVIQRAYSAASKIITTADEMLDELTRLKR